MTPFRYRRIRDAELSVRTANALCKLLGEDATMGEVFETSDRELLTTGKLGRKSLKEVRDLINYARDADVFERRRENEIPILPPAMIVDTDPMTPRDQFAAAALPGVMDACRRDSRPEGVALPEWFALKAYEVADAMMKERAK